MVANLYCTVDEVRAEQGISDAIDDAKIELTIEAMSRAIDAETWRKFYSTNETRYYSADNSKYIYIDDLTSVDTLKTDSAGDRTYATTWTVTDYDLYPINATLDGYPYTMVQSAPNGNYGFPLGLSKGVQIKGDFGYIASGGTVPPQIKAATLLGVLRVLQRFDTPLGVSAAAALGQLNVVIRELRLDPDFVQLIAPFKKVI